MREMVRLELDVFEMIAYLGAACSPPRRPGRSMPRSTARRSVRRPFGTKRAGSKHRPDATCLRELPRFRGKLSLGGAAIGERYK